MFDTPDTVDRINGWISTFAAADADAAYLLVDRHESDAIAFTTVRADGDDLVVEDFSYGMIAEKSRRLARILANLGVRQGDSVGVLMGKRIEIAVSLAALARLGAVYLPLFTAFAPPAIKQRLDAAQARVVITESAQSEKLTGLDVFTLQVGDELDRTLDSTEPWGESVAVGGDGRLALLFTSGTTGNPKGVPIPVRAMAAFTCYMTYGLDLREDDVFWNAADPGWAYGFYYGIIGPMAVGRRNILLRGAFSPQTTARVLTSLGVTNFASAPTVYRTLTKDPAITGFTLRRASSAGEPLTPDVVTWARSALGVEVRDHYGQTEHGMFVNNHWHDDFRRPVTPGSMGFAMPGFSVDVVDGQLAMDVSDSPLAYFTGYLDAPEATAGHFTDDGIWYLTGDTGRRDDAGRFYFSARDDDVIIMAGYRIGPFEVESVLITHPAVADVAVVGVPDGLRGEVLVAHVVLRPEYVGSELLERELQTLVKTDFAAHAYPRSVYFVDQLPKTPSGKIQRYLLRRTEQPAT